MADYTVTIKPSARKELEHLPNWALARAVSAIEALSREPRPRGCKKLKDYNDTWQIRIGDWRVVYTIDDEAFVVRITRVAHRREVYDRP